MYFSAKLSIDPSQITMIKKVKPTKIFAKFIDTLTFGTLSEKQEQETFTAVAILQQLNMGLRSINVKNVIRLAMDDYNFYLDEKGLDDDLKQAMFEFEAKIDPLESELFNTLYLVLEHDLNNIKYIIEISVNRKHNVGEFPISITVNGLLEDFKLEEGETRDQLQTRMELYFKDQSQYDELLQIREAQFNQFIDDLEFATRKFVKVDEIRRDFAREMIRPKQKVNSVEEMKHDRHTHPVYYGYYGYDSYFFYGYLWAGMCFSNNIYCSNVNIVDEYGSDVMSVGDDGFLAGETNTLNDGANFEAPTGGDVTYYGDNEFGDDLKGANISTVGETADSGGGSDWLDSGSADSGDASSCSSCSSCGGCGGCT